MLWPLFIRDGRNRDGQRALDPCDPSSGHCMRRWLLSEGCVHGALDFLRHAAVLSADSNVRSPFLGCSQRRRRAGGLQKVEKYQTVTAESGESVSPSHHAVMCS